MVPARVSKQPSDGRSNQRWLHPAVIASGWASLFNDVSSEMIYPLLPVFLTSALGVGVGFVGVIEGVAESAASLLKLFSGWLSDRLGKRKALVLVGYVLASVARPLIAVAVTGWDVLGLRFADRVGKGIRGAPRDALVADYTDESKRGVAYGYQRAMDHAGAVMGPLIATVLLAALSLGYRTIFALAAIPAALCVVTVWLFVKEPSLPTVRQAQVSPISALRSCWRASDHRLKGLLLAVGLFALGNSSDAFLILRARDLGVRLELIPIIWVVLHASKSLLSIPGGFLSDRIGRRPTIIAGWIVYSLVYLGFALSWSTWHAWFLFAAYGLYFSLTEGVERALVADVVRSEQRGVAFGLYNFVLGMAALPASLIFGGVWERVGFRAAFLMGATLALAAAALLVALTKSSGVRYEHIA
jgi:MFS family permease